MPLASRAHHPRSEDVAPPTHYGSAPRAQQHRPGVLPAEPFRAAVPGYCRNCGDLLSVHSRDHPVRAIFRARRSYRGHLLRARNREVAGHGNRPRARRSLTTHAAFTTSSRKEEHQVDLPTYTNIWRIEKRLYKLYDFRLPMPLPLGQIAVFTAIAVPYVVVLAVLGLPFSHTLLWLYVLPPAVLAWFATRPVLESKRLPELAASQLRYLNEPRTWCRMAPLTEKDEAVVTARVWRRAAGMERAEQADRVPQDALAELDALAEHDALAGRDEQVELELRDGGADREERVNRQERDVEPAVPGLAAATALPLGRDATPGRWPVLRSAPRLAPVAQQPEADVAQPVRAAD